MSNKIDNPLVVLLAYFQILTLVFIISGTFAPIFAVEYETSGYKKIKIIANTYRGVREGTGNGEFTPYLIGMPVVFVIEFKKNGGLLPLGWNEDMVYGLRDIKEKVELSLSPKQVVILTYTGDKATRMKKYYTPNSHGYSLESNLDWYLTLDYDSLHLKADQDYIFQIGVKNEIDARCKIRFRFSKPSTPLQQHEITVERSAIALLRGDNAGAAKILETLPLDVLNTNVIGLRNPNVLLGDAYIFSNPKRALQLYEKAFEIATANGEKYLESIEYRIVAAKERMQHETLPGLKNNITISQTSTQSVQLPLTSP